MQSQERFRPDQPEFHLVWPCNRVFLLAMNVTVKLPDDLCRQARHRAVDESKSLSAWLAGLVEKELSAPATDSRALRTFVDAFASEHPDWFYEKDLPLEDRKSGKVRGSLFESGG